MCGQGIGGFLDEIGLGIGRAFQCRAVIGDRLGGLVELGVGAGAAKQGPRLVRVAIDEIVEQGQGLLRAAGFEQRATAQQVHIDGGIELAGGVAVGEGLFPFFMFAIDFTAFQIELGVLGLGLDQF